MLRRTIMGVAAACSLAAAPAYAQVSIGAAPGTAPYSGPAATYDFESPAPVVGGLVTTGSVNGVRAQPFGSSGNYWTVGPSDGSPGVLDLSTFASIGAVSFIWGSVDAYNTIEVFDRLGVLIDSFTGADVALPANGDQVDPSKNPIVTLSFSGATRDNIGGLRLISTQNAFEVDNFSVTAVPEPGVWAMLLVGFGFIGSFMRRQKRQRRLRVNYA